MDFVLRLTRRLCEIGKSNRDVPPVSKVKPFQHYFSKTGDICHDLLGALDGPCTRREVLTRYLLMSVVLDQGPDLAGVRELLKGVTEELYSAGIRIFHRPGDFFLNLGRCIKIIEREHERVKSLRAREWAQANLSHESRYNLFFAQSLRGLVPIGQVLDYAMHRWGVPLGVSLLLVTDRPTSDQPLVDYVESHPSAEVMARKLKTHSHYGLGSAIGDKACHLFAKLYVSVMRLVQRCAGDEGWQDVSYEIPFDSNAGRVLFRTGFLLELASLDEYEAWNVIQKRRGKHGAHYIRVTNIRGRGTHGIDRASRLFSDYIHVIRDHLTVGQRPRLVQIQHVPNLLVHVLRARGLDLSVADFDDGLIHVGRNYCFNHSEPNCCVCPVADLCIGRSERRDLIEDYTT
ncbi:MAG: hypothetical protein ACTSYX_06975 [Candidatus Thorarchaeota archaeon]